MADRYWVGGSGTWDASSTTNWAASSGGASGASAPSSVDNVIFDNSSDSGANYAVTVSSAVCANLTVTAQDFILTLGTGTASNIDIYGSVSINPVTFGRYASGTGNSFTMRSTGAYAISLSNTSGILCAGITFAAGAGSLSSSIQVTGNATIGAGATSLNIGFQQLAVGGNFDNSAAKTFSGGGIINMYSTSSKTFTGGGVTYPTLRNGGAGALTIAGSNTFTTIENTAGPRTFTFTSGTTQTVTNFNVSGTAGNLVTITATSTGAATLSKTSGTVSVSYCNISKSNATGGATWRALTADGNVDGGGNSGWTFGLGGNGLFFGSNF
jgi:hypothetical protein